MGWEDELKQVEDSMVAEFQVKKKFENRLGQLLQRLDSEGGIMLCPLRTRRGSGRVIDCLCVKELCRWWNDAKQDCAVNIMASMLVRRDVRDVKFRR